MSTTARSNGLVPTFWLWGLAYPLVLALVAMLLRFLVAPVTGGADANVRDHEHWTPLHVATRKDNLLVLYAMIVLGANVNARDEIGTRPLHEDEMFGEWESRTQGPSEILDTEVVRTLLAAGASVNARDNLQQTPLHVAAALNHDLEVVELLLAAEAELNALDRSGETPPDNAAFRPKIREILQAHAAAGR